VVVVMSDRERAQALDRARAAGVDGRFVNPKDFPTATPTTRPRA